MSLEIMNVSKFSKIIEEVVIDKRIPYMTLLSGIVRRMK